MQDCRGCDTCPVRRRGICSELTDKQLQAVGRVSRKKFARAGQPISRDGSEALRYAAVMSGAIKLDKPHPDGRLGVLGMMFAGDFLGRVLKFHRAYKVRAATDVLLCVFPREELAKLTARSPSLERKLFEGALQQHETCRDWTVLLREGSAYRRVASFLLFLAKRMPRTAPPGPFDVNTAQFQTPLTRQEIAGVLDMTEETACRQMTLMKRQGVIGLISSREVSVPDLRLLAALAKGDGGAVAERERVASTARGKFASHLPRAREGRCEAKATLAH